MSVVLEHGKTEKLRKQTVCERQTREEEATWDMKKWS